MDKDGFVKVSEIQTPALLIDLNVLESNLSKMASFFSGVPAKLRAHVKNHKTPILAHKQIQAGSAGICCAKLGEAEVMVAAGIKDILITTEVVDPQKIARLVNLNRHADVKVVVDNPQNVWDLSSAAHAKGLKLGVLVEVDVGMNRCGVVPGEQALELAREVERAPGLHFMGLQGYEGHASFVSDYAARKQLAEEAMKLLIDTKHLIEGTGLEVPVVSAGGTGTYAFTGRYPGVTEVQAGSYATMSTRYSHVSQDFGYAVTVLCTVISRPARDRIIVDAGSKAISWEFGLPLVKNVEGAEAVRLSVEHGKIELSDPGIALVAGDRIELVPSFEHTTINLYDKFHAVRDGWVEAVWEIAARGRCD